MILNKLRFRHFNVFCIVIKLTLLYSSYIYAKELPVLAAPQILASSAILIDFDSGTVLVDKCADVRRAPASLTKIMTSYIVGQALKSHVIESDDLVKISHHAWSKNFNDSSKMFIKSGDVVTVNDLNRGMVIVSGNDACVALAEHIAGNEKGFVDIMNHYAQVMQLNNTHFTNVHGLDQANQYSCARDMALLAKILISDLPDEYAIYKEKSFTYNKISQPNRNGLLWDSYLQVDGIKTGQTQNAKFNLVASATQGNMRLIAVVMGADSVKAREQEVRKLLLWGFRCFENNFHLDKDDIATYARVWLGAEKQIPLGIDRSVHLLVPRGRTKDIQCHYVLNKPLKAPLNQDQIVGVVNFELDNKTLAQRNLRVLNPVYRSHLLARLNDYIHLWWDQKFK